MNKIMTVPTRIVCLLRAQKVRQAFSTIHFPLLRGPLKKREAHISKLFVVSKLGGKSLCILKPRLSAVLNRRSRARSLCDRVHPAMGNTSCRLQTQTLFGQFLIDSRVESYVHLHPSSLAEVQGEGEKCSQGAGGGGRTVGVVE